MFEVSYAKSAATYIQKLPSDVQTRILSVIERARIRPESHFERMVGEKAYKLRVGDYRIIADIYKNELQILVINVGHRRSIYK